MLKPNLILYEGNRRLHDTIGLAASPVHMPLTRRRKQRWTTCHVANACWYCESASIQGHMCGLHRRGIGGHSGPITAREGRTSIHGDRNWGHGWRLRQGLNLEAGERIQPETPESFLEGRAGQRRPWSHHTKERGGLGEKSIRLVFPAGVFFVPRILWVA